MYKKILVALENSLADQSLLPHITQLAQLLHSHLLLVHVAEGWAARHYEDFLLKDSRRLLKTASILKKKQNY